MNVLKIENQPNGSAIVEVEMTESEKDFLIEFGFNQMVRQGLELFEKDLIKERVCFDCDYVIDKETLEKYPDTEICKQCISASTIGE